MTGLCTNTGALGGEDHRVKCLPVKNLNSPSLTKATYARFCFRSLLFAFPVKSVMASASRDAAALTITLPIGPIEIPQLHAQSSQNPTPTVEALIVCVSAYAMIPTITRVPRIVLADKPFEIELGVAALEPGADETASAWAARTISCYLSNLAMLSVVIDSEGQVPSLLDVPVAVRHTCGGLIARALVRPSAWADAASVTVASLTLAGRSLPCDCLPATLRVGYNHAPAPKAAVLVASKRGDVPALRGALDDGGSTEETDEVCAWSGLEEGEGI